MDGALGFLVQAAGAAPSADNSQPWHLTWDGSSMLVEYDGKRVSGHSFPGDNTATLLALGSAVENLVEAARLMGRSAEVVRVGGGARVGVGSLAGLVPPPTTGPLFDRHTNRLPYRAEALPPDLLARLGGARQGEARCAVVSGAESVRRLAGLVRRCSVVRFRTRELHEWLDRSLRFGIEAEGGDGLDVATLDLPPGGSVLLRVVRRWWCMRLLGRLGIDRFMAFVDARPLGLAPAVLAVVAPAGTEAALDGGRLLARVWTAANAAGVAVHPYYVVTDLLGRRDEGLLPPSHARVLDEVEAELPGLLGLGPGERPLMLLRLGCPCRQAVRSRRLPRDRIFTQASGA